MDQHYCQMYKRFQRIVEHPRCLPIQGRQLRYDYRLRAKPDCPGVIEIGHLIRRYLPYEKRKARRMVPLKYAQFRPLGEFHPTHMDIWGLARPYEHLYTENPEVDRLYPNAYPPWLRVSQYIVPGFTNTLRHHFSPQLMVFGSGNPLDPRQKWRAMGQTIISASGARYDAKTQKLASLDTTDTTPQRATREQQKAIKAALERARITLGMYAKILDASQPMPLQVNGPTKYASPREWYDAWKTDKSIESPKDFRRETDVLRMMIYRVSLPRSEYTRYIEPIKFDKNASSWKTLQRNLYYWLGDI